MTINALRLIRNRTTLKKFFTWQDDYVKFILPR